MWEQEVGGSNPPAPTGISPCAARAYVFGRNSSLRRGAQQHLHIVRLGDYLLRGMLLPAHPDEFLSFQEQIRMLTCEPIRFWETGQQAKT